MIPMRNFNHDLVQQLSELLDGIWRIDEYSTNAKNDGCDRCMALWKDMKGRLTDETKLLRDEITKHVEEKTFN